MVEGIGFGNRRTFAEDVLVFLISVPIVCFAGALLTDTAYANSPDIQWSNFSAWLLAVGMVFGGIAALLGVFLFFRSTRRPRMISDWIFIVSSIIVLILALLNNFVHTRDSWTSVWPGGISLSIITVVFILIAAVSRYLSLRSSRTEQKG